MNRAQRRAQAHRTARTVVATTTGMPACADCTAVAEPVILSPGVVSVTIAHDPTCPTYQRTQRSTP